MSIITQQDISGLTITLPIDHPLTNRIKKLIIAHNASEQLAKLDQPRLNITLTMLLNSVDLLLLTELRKLMSGNDAKAIEVITNAINEYGEL